MGTKTIDVAEVTVSGLTQYEIVYAVDIFTSSSNPSPFTAPLSPVKEYAFPFLPCAYAAVPVAGVFHVSPAPP